MNVNICTGKSGRNARKSPHFGPATGVSSSAATSFSLNKNLPKSPTGKNNQNNNNNNKNKKTLRSSSPLLSNTGFKDNNALEENVEATSSTAAAAAATEDEAAHSHVDLPCACCHVPYPHNHAPFANMRLVPCQMCQLKKRSKLKISVFWSTFTILVEIIVVTLF